jgi:hypothetical protein
VQKSGQGASSVASGQGARDPESERDSAWDSVSYWNIQDLVVIDGDSAVDYLLSRLLLLLLLLCLLLLLLEVAALAVAVASVRDPLRRHHVVPVLAEASRKRLNHVGRDVANAPRDRHERQRVVLVHRARVCELLHVDLNTRFAN